MENFTSLIAVKCNNQYTNQLDNISNITKTLGSSASSIDRVYKCYGTYDYVICMKPSQNTWHTTEECCTKLRSQSWVSTTDTSFGKECYTSTVSEGTTA